MRLPTTLVLALVLAGCGGASAPTCLDADGDGYGVGSTCLGLDCDDANADAFPGAMDVVGDEIDSDCNNIERCFADLLLRSRIVTCATASDDVTGLFVGNDVEGSAALVAAVGNVFEIGRSTSGRATGIALEGTRANAILAQNTVHLETESGGEAHGLAVIAQVSSATRLTAMNNVISVAGEGTASCVALPGAGASASIGGNDLYAPEEEQCEVSVGDVCVAASDVPTCAFTGCRSSAANLTSDPAYVDADRHLAAESLCIDAGVSLEGAVPVALFTRDIDGDTRPQGTALDIGADERVP